MVRHPDKRDLHHELEISSHPIYAEIRDRVAVFIPALRSASTTDAFYQLHLELFEAFLSLQQRLESLATEKKIQRSELRDRKEAGRMEDVRRLSQALARTESDRRAADAALSLIRVLGDALVWALIGYERSAATILGDGKRVNRLSNPQALRAEVEVIDRAWSEGKVAIHTDITGCLQHGDVLTVETWEPRTFTLAEVKAGGGRNRRQLARLERAVSLLNGGSYPGDDDRGPLEIASSDVAYRSYVGAAADALARARKDSYVARQVDDVIAIEVYDEANPAGLSRSDFEERERAFRGHLGWDSADSIVYSIAARRLRDRDHTFASLAPLPMLPFSAEDTAGLLTGALDIVSTLNCAALEGGLAERGIEAVVARDETRYDVFLTARRGIAQVVVPATSRELISVELLVPEAFVEMVDWVLSALEARGRGEPTLLVDYSDEDLYWTDFAPARA